MINTEQFFEEIDERLHILKSITKLKLEKLKVHLTIKQILLQPSALNFKFLSKAVFEQMVFNACVLKKWKMHFSRNKDDD